jgi:hypothetical protein
MNSGTSNTTEARSLNDNPTPQGNQMPGTCTAASSEENRAYGQYSRKGVPAFARVAA